jgi:hypothetical protein
MLYPLSYEGIPETKLPVLVGAFGRVGFGAEPRSGRRPEVVAAGLGQAAGLRVTVLPSFSSSRMR